jgi:hypothetical protein
MTVLRSDVLCHAPPFRVPTGQTASTGPLPTGAASSELTASNLQVTPIGGTNNGYRSNGTISADPRFAIYPSTSSSGTAPAQDVRLAGAGTNVPTRYVLGPVGLDRSAVARAQAVTTGGQWVIDLTRTPEGSARWDTLARQSFHAFTGAVINGLVVSAPIVQPTQTSFSSSDGHLQIAGGFTERPAKAIASARS